MYIIALLAAVWHLGWVFALWNATEPMMATPIAPYYMIFNSSNSVAWMLIAVSALALVGKMQNKSDWILLGCIVPQQMTLMASAWAALGAVVYGHYPDLVPRPREFIFADQWGNMIPAIMHTWYVFWLAKRGLNKKESTGTAT